MKKLILSTVLLGMLSPAFAQSTSVAASCGLPVCSMSEQMTALRAMNGDQRGMYSINLKAQYKDASDTKVL